MFNTGNGILGFLILVADIWAIINVVQSNDENLKKALWIALILVLPFAGVLLWYFLGPRGRNV